MRDDAIAGLLADFTREYSLVFIGLGHRQSQILELCAVVAVQDHYRSLDYDVAVRHPDGGRDFVVKTSTRGHPSRYSRIVVTKDGDVAEIHMNLLVRGAHDEGIYCVDVAIVEPGVVPGPTDHKSKWECLANEALISFAEVKRLAIYPMLLAQFVGIVHELKPEFLSGQRRLLQDTHLAPTLIVLGHFSGNSRHIVQTYAKRGFRVQIAEGIDLRIAAYRAGKSKSPIVWNEASSTSTVAK